MHISFDPDFAWMGEWYNILFVFLGLCYVAAIPIVRHVCYDEKDVRELCCVAIFLAAPLTVPIWLILKATCPKNPVLEAEALALAEKMATEKKASDEKIAAQKAKTRFG